MMIRIAKYGHLQDRMKERGITDVEIEWIFNNSSTSWSSGGGRSRVYSGTTPSGKVLHVVVKDPPESDGTVIVKTAYDPSLEESE